MLIVAKEPKSAIAEAYRTLRTNIQFANLDRSVKKILITSVGPGEGKTTTVVNLGVTMAMTGSRTLIVDSDLRRPTVHKFLGLDNTIGMTTFLADRCSIEDALRQTEVPQVSVLTSGPIPPNPAELLGSRKVAQLIADLETGFDAILFDSPPVISVSDAMVLSTLVDGVILVIRSGGLPFDIVRRGKEQLEGVKANFLGTVINSVDLAKEAYYYRYYYYYYYQYYKYGYGYEQDGKRPKR